MADAIVALGRVMAAGQGGMSSLMAADAQTDVMAGVASSTTSSLTGDGAKALRVTAKDGALWVKCGESPTAAVDTDGNHFVPEGGQIEFARFPRGWTVAVIADS